MSKRKINFMSLLEDYFETYLPYSRGLSLNTINSYKQSFLLLMRFMFEAKGIAASDIKFSDLTYETLLEFLNWLETDRLCTPATRNQRLRQRGEPFPARTFSMFSNNSSGSGQAYPSIFHRIAP